MSFPLPLGPIIVSDACCASFVLGPPSLERNNALLSVFWIILGGGCIRLVFLNWSKKASTMTTYHRESATAFYVTKLGRSTDFSPPVLGILNPQPYGVQSCRAVICRKQGSRCSQPLSGRNCIALPFPTGQLVRDGILSKLKTQTEPLDPGIWWNQIRILFCTSQPTNWALRVLCIAHRRHQIARRAGRSPDRLLMWTQSYHGKSNHAASNTFD
ncbi:hypothetical protein BDW67DRAFT_72964 [Aspergillus spinulosporus]